MLNKSDADAILAKVMSNDLSGPVIFDGGGALTIDEVEKTFSEIVVKGRTQRYDARILFQRSDERSPFEAVSAIFDLSEAAWQQYEAECAIARAQGRL